jgi:hypothetical protein
MIKMRPPRRPRRDGAGVRNRPLDRDQIGYRRTRKASADGAATEGNGMTAAWKGPCLGSGSNATHQSCGGIKFMIKRLSRVSVAATLIALMAVLAISPSAYASTRSSMSARSTASNAPVQRAGLGRSSVSTVRSNASSAAAPATVLGIILQNNFTKNFMEFTAAKGLQRGPCNGSGAQEWRLATPQRGGDPGQVPECHHWRLPSRRCLPATSVS